MARPPKNPSENDARRLLRLIARSSSVAGDHAAYEGWCRVVGIATESISPDDQTTLAYEIIADVRRMISRLGVSYSEVTTGTGYKAMLSRVQHATNIQYVSGQWQVIINQLNAGENSAILEGMADALPHEGDTIPFDAIESTIAEVDELIRRLEQSDLPTFHKHYAHMLLGRLRQSLRQYIIFGARPIHEYAAFNNGIVADLNANPSEIAEAAALEPDDQKLLDQIVNVTHRVTEWSKTIYYVGGATGMLYHAATIAVPLISRVVTL